MREVVSRLKDIYWSNWYNTLKGFKVSFSCVDRLLPSIKGFTEYPLQPWCKSWKFLSDVTKISLNEPQRKFSIICNVKRKWESFCLLISSSFGMFNISSIKRTLKLRSELKSSHKRRIFVDGGGWWLSSTRFIVDFSRSSKKPLRTRYTLSQWNCRQLGSTEYSSCEGDGLLEPPIHPVFWLPDSWRPHFSTPVWIRLYFAGVCAFFATVPLFVVIPTLGYGRVGHVNGLCASLCVWPLRCGMEWRR